MHDASAVVERVVLTGPAVAIPGFPERLGEQVGLPLEVGVVQEDSRADSAASTPAASPWPPA